MTAGDFVTFFLFVNKEKCIVAQPTELGFYETRRMPPYYYVYWLEGKGIVSNGMTVPPQYRDLPNLEKVKLERVKIAIPIAQASPSAAAAWAFAHLEELQGGPTL